VRRATRDARRLFDHFFDVLEAITPDLDLAFAGIDPNTYEIRVKTTGGVVPLESVSQGTTAVIGWVGVLLQRMHEVLPKLENPAQGSALVMVDELDAHMHPYWQQQIVQQLRALFPNVQFIVTTHSPLVLSSMESRQVFMFKKREAGIVVEKPDFDVRGLRADQLLTTPLFDLDTARDPVVHEKLLAYTKLAARDHLDEADAAELRQLADFLGLQLPRPQERAEARAAFDLIEDSLNEKIDSMPEEKKQRVLDEVKVQLQEIVSGTRRPE
jgi:predicted ATP-binding protein involved in virulence